MTNGNATGTKPKLFLLIDSVESGVVRVSYQPDTEKGEWAVCSDGLQEKLLSGQDIDAGDFCIVQMEDPMVFSIWAFLVTEINFLD